MTSVIYMMCMMFKWCTYETRFSNGFYYLGKGMTDRVNKGTYTGSGIRYRLALLHWQDSLNLGELTVTTRTLNTYATEAEAYAAEELLIPIQLLADPYCLNMHSGGLKGKYQTPGRLLRSINAAKRTMTRKQVADRAKVKTQMLKNKIKELKKK